MENFHRFNRYVGDPLKHAEKLTESKIGEYRFRIGDYRVIFALEGDEIVVLRAGHRKDIYRKLLGGPQHGNFDTIVASDLDCS